MCWSPKQRLYWDSQFIVPMDCMLFFINRSKRWFHLKFLTFLTSTKYVVVVSIYPRTLLTKENIGIFVPNHKKQFTRVHLVQLLSGQHIDIWLWAVHIKNKLLLNGADSNLTIVNLINNLKNTYISRNIGRIYADCHWMASMARPMVIHVHVSTAVIGCLELILPWQASSTIVRLSSTKVNIKE